MPRALWQTPQPAGGFGGFAPYDDEPQGGLAGFFNSPDAGAEISDRLGGIAEILMRLGSGQGGQGIAAMQGGINERSAARRDRRKMERMVRRAADKIAPSNPEMAAMMYANPEYGMQILGKKYESEWSNAAQMEQLKKQYELQGANQIAVEREKQRLISEQAELDYKRVWGDDATAGATTGGYDPRATQAVTPITQTDTAAIAPVAPTPPAVPRGVDPVTQQPLMGQGSEPAPSQLPVPQPVVSQPEQAAPVEAVAQPELSSMPEPPPLSKNPEMAARQRRLERRLGVPVAEWGVQAMLTAHGKGGASETAVINNIQQDWARQVSEHRKTQTEDRRIRDANAQKQIDAEAQAKLEREQPGIRQEEFRQGFESESGSRGAETVGYRQPDVETIQILHEAGFDDRDIQQMPDPEAQASAIMAGVGQGPEGQRGAITATRGELGKARADIEKQQAANQQGRVIARTVDKMLETLPAENTPAGQDPIIQQARQQLVSIKQIPDADKATKALDDWRTVNGQLAQAMDKHQVDLREIAVKEADLKLKQDKQTADTKAEKEKSLSANKSLKQQSLNAIEQLERGIEVINDSSQYTTTGALGQAMGFIPGTARQQLEAIANTVESVAAQQNLMQIRRDSPTGASLSGISDNDIALLKQDVMDFRSALASGESTEYAFKKMHNHFMNIYDPVGTARKGGMRFDEQGAGFVLREFDLRRDNPIEYEYLTEKYGTEDVESIIYKGKNVGGDEDQRRTDRAPGPDPLGLF